MAGHYPPGGYEADDSEQQTVQQQIGDVVQPSADQVRAARIAELAARLTAIESRDRAAASGQDASCVSGQLGVSGRNSHAIRPKGASDPPPGEHPSSRSGTGSTGPAPGSRWPGGPASRDGSWASVPIGSSGSTGVTDRRRGTPGGHPEDAPGDPEAVAKAVCLRLLTGAARPRAALATALRQRGIPDDVAVKVLDRFVEVGLIDDEAYAAAFVAAKHRDRALGVSALRTELRRKGVDEVVVDAAVQTVDSEAERGRARALISRRVDAAMGHGLPAARRRLVGLLARRGYSAELSGQVVDEALAAYGAEQDVGWLD